MKRLWIASALLVLLLAVSLGNAWYSNALTQSLAQPLPEGEAMLHRLTGMGLTAEQVAEAALERAQEQLRQKQSIQEYHVSQASMARAMLRLKEAGKYEIN